MISVKCKFSVSKDLLMVYPQKVTHSAPFSLVSDKWFLWSTNIVRDFSVFIC